MKKSLVVLTVILASVALASVAFAAGKAACVPPPPMKCEFETKVEPGKPKLYVPIRVTPKPPKCAVMPLPQIPVTIPGEPYADALLPVNVWIKDTAPVYRDLCVGKSAGKCPAFCGPCPPMITWSAAWKTREECGRVAYKFMVPPGHLVRRPANIKVNCKLTPIQPECLW